MMHLYSALLCIAEHPKRFTIMCVWGGGLFSTTTISLMKSAYFGVLTDILKHALVFDLIET